MGSVSSLFPPATAADAAANTPAAASPNNANGLANESTFLQLLVAQLKNQNPAQPMDGTTFVTQLAQFSELEQSLASRQDLDNISSKYMGTAATTPSSADSSTDSTGAS
jgi:flagellar basal-body rod modification protein FlgD